MGSDRTIKAENNTSDRNLRLWPHFTSAKNQDDYYRSWLALQCNLIPNIIQAILVMGDSGTDSFKPVSKWPEEGEDAERLAEISERAIGEQCGLLVELDISSDVAVGSQPHYGVAYPIFIDDKPHGVIAAEVAARSQDQLKLVMEHLQWGVSWIELFSRRCQVKEAGASLSRLKFAVDLLAGTLAEERFEGAAMAFVTELATHLKCDRVSLGFLKKHHVYVKALSHSAQFGKRMNLIRSIEKAMDEAIFQRCEILYPSAPDAKVLLTRDHKELGKQHGSGSILTIPFYDNDRWYGALTLERPTEQPFNEDEIEFCRSVSALVFPALENKRLNDRLLIKKVSESFQQQIARFFGPRYPGRKLAGLILVSLVVFFSIKTGEYRVAADATLEGAVRRVVAAPFDSYIKDAHKRAGDIVQKDMEMCLLDDRDLRLERLNWLTKQKQYQRQYQEARAKYNRAEAKIISALLDQATAKLNLMKSKIERTVIRAPFDGIIVSGNLSQMLGGLVKQGEILFEVAPLDAYRIILKVDERRIADVRAGQEGRLVLSALPRSYFDFTIEKVIPITSAEEGRNYFRVEAKLAKKSERLRPGMEGVGKIFVDRRNLISIWTRDLTEWLRLWFWSWWP